jgi:hypothetical protein
MNNVNVAKSRLRWAGHVARIGKTRNVYRFLIERSLERRIRRLEDNIRTHVTEMDCEDVNWNELVQENEFWY